MKRYIWLVVVAVMLTACGGGNNHKKDDVRLPEKDQKALNHSTYEALEALGMRSESVARYLSVVGFERVGEVPIPEIDMPSMPRRIRQSNPFEGSTAELYVYGISPDDVQLEGDAFAAKQNAVLESGSSVMMVYALYNENRLYILETTLMVPLIKEVNKVYTDLSDQLYNTIPEDSPQTYWYGALGAEGEQVYTTHSNYVAAVLGKEAVIANELGLALTSVSLSGYEGFGYLCGWTNPDEETQAKQAQAGYTPFVQAYFVVADAGALMEMYMEFGEDGGFGF